MKKLVAPLGRVIVILLLLAGLSVCTMSDQAASTPPEDALSFDQLLEGLDGLQGPATQSPSAPGMSVFAMPNGSLLSSADLSAYLNAIKRDLASYIYSCTGGRPYLVVARPLRWNPDPANTTVFESGLIWIPVTWWGRPISTPIISFQHGMQVYREYAPSRFNANPLTVLSSPDLTGALQNYVECIVGALMATAGYTVVMPDYQGFGDSILPHPYVHLSLGKSVVGALGAARRLLDYLRVPLRSGLYLTGYSEGGYATMAGALAIQMLPQESRPPITRTIPCDGAYDLSGTMLTQMLTNDPPVKVPSYLLNTAAGYDAAYPATEGGDPVELYKLLEKHRADLIAVEGLFSGHHTNADVSREVPASTLPSSMLNSSTGLGLLAEGGAVYNLLLANNAWNGLVGSPINPVFVHCPLDDVVPIGNATRAAANLGAEIRYVPPIPFVAQVMGSIHVGAFPTAMLEAFKIIRGN